jgi:hypothetical protein
MTITEHPRQECKDYFEEVFMRRPQTWQLITSTIGFITVIITVVAIYYVDIMGIKSDVRVINVESTHYKESSNRLSNELKEFSNQNIQQMQTITMELSALRQEIQKR